MNVTQQLLAAGWVRSDRPASQVPECGMWPGYCVNSARWTEGGLGKPMCAVHAFQLVRRRRQVAR